VEVPARCPVHDIHSTLLIQLRVHHLDNSHTAVGLVVDAHHANVEHLRTVAHRMKYNNVTTATAFMRIFANMAIIRIKPAREIQMIAVLLDLANQFDPVNFSSKTQIRFLNSRLLLQLKTVI